MLLQVAQLNACLAVLGRSDFLTSEIVCGSSVFALSTTLTVAPLLTSRFCGVKCWSSVTDLPGVMDVPPAMSMRFLAVAAPATPTRREDAASTAVAASATVIRRVMRIQSLLVWPRVPPRGSFWVVDALITLTSKRASSHHPSGRFGGHSRGRPVRRRTAGG